MGKNTIVLESIQEIIPNGNKTVVSDLSASSYWGYSNFLNSKAYVNVKKGYNSKKLNSKYIVKKQLVESKLLKHTKKILYNNRVFYIQSKEAAFIQVIKRIGIDINDQLVDFIKSFFNSGYDHNKLIKIARENRVEKEIIMVERIING